jgi:hypothetical protein
MANIQIFNSKGEFVAMSDEAIAALDDSKRERYGDLQTAAELAAKAESDLKTIQELLAQSVERVREAQAKLLKLRPKLTHVDLAKDMIRQGDRDSSRERLCREI